MRRQLISLGFQRALQLFEMFGIVLTASLSLSQANTCPSSDTASIWPSGQGMYTLESTAGGSSQSSCCFYKWVLPTKFGAEQEVLAALNGTTTAWCSQGNCGSESLCTTAVTLKELSEAALQGK